MKSALLLLGLLVFTCTARGQSDFKIPSGRQPGELLVQLADEADVQRVVAALRQADGRASTLFLKKTVAASWHIYLLGFDEATADADALWSLALHTPGIRTAQWNYLVEDRNIPNDPRWSQQIDMSLIRAADAWEASTGGLTSMGDTIVVAVLEKGALLEHPDLVDNVWYNWREVPDNNIDDDNNGYVDDYRGYDVRLGGDGPGNVGSHGTSVNGIIGARGNNGVGVAGVNWVVKLMNFSNVGDDAEIVTAYEYATKMRRRYNQSNGLEGAFVVVTNASFGRDFARAADHPLWCAAYDSLGAVGVLSVGATSNGHVNVEVEGDMPSTCPSEYLLVVNNVIAATGAKSPATGYGATSVDLGAPGDNSFTTSNAGTMASYGNFTGTSAATPHVSGAVALLYSLDCDQLVSDAISAPASCARRVRDVVFNNVEHVASLDNITTTGGRLDLANCVNGVRQLCEASVGPLKFLECRHFANNTWEVFFQTPTLEAHSFRVFNMLGQLMYETKVQPAQFAASRVTFDANNLARGIYVMTLSRGKFRVSKKFLKI